MPNNKYPRYFEVDDIYVVLDLDGDDVVAYTYGGRPYGIGKAIIEGREITQDEYKKAVRTHQAGKRDY